MLSNGGRIWYLPEQSSTLEWLGLGWMLNAFKVFVALDRRASPGAKLNKEVVMRSPLRAHSTVTLVGGALPGLPPLLHGLDVEGLLGLGLGLLIGQLGILLGRLDQWLIGCHFGSVS